MRSHDAVDIFFYPGDKVIVQGSICGLSVIKSREKEEWAHL